MAKRAKLDKKKPFGSIYGRGNRRFEQGGEFFDVEGNHVPDEVVADTGGEVGGDDQLTALAIENEQLKKQLAELTAPNNAVPVEPAKADTAEEDKPAAAKADDKKTPSAEPKVGKGKKTAETTETSEIDDQLAAQGQV